MGLMMSYNSWSYLDSGEHQCLGEPTHHPRDFVIECYILWIDDRQLNGLGSKNIIRNLTYFTRESRHHIRDLHDLNRLK